MPKRVMAVRKSVKGLPVVLNAAELAACISRAAKQGPGADDFYDLVQLGLRIGQSFANSDNDIREARKIDRASGYFGSEVSGTEAQPLVCPGRK